jgi:uncharacterized protein with PIN domain
MNSLRNGTGNQFATTGNSIRGNRELITGNRELAQNRSARRDEALIPPSRPPSALRVALACGSWGKGVHPAALNFGDCFAYELAKEHACRLLHVGDDFSKTDIPGVL